MNSLVRLYPQAWRARYGLEFEALLTERPPSTRDLIDIILAALDAHLAPQVQSTAIPRRVHVTDRLAGGAAVAGGLLWCLTYLSAGITNAEADYGLPLIASLGLMLGSLPGKYLGRYVRSVLLGGAALGLSLLVLYGGLLGWGPILLVPGLIILGALGPGALALAATRAGMVARDRWRLLLLAMPLPIIAGIFASIGLAPQPIWVPFVVAAMLPLGVAWIAIGARISRGSTISTAGGI